MAFGIPLQALAQWAQTIDAAVTRTINAAMLEGVELAYKDAVLAARANFNNTPGRVRTGQLMNGLYRRYDPTKQEGFIGESAVYGRVQELGGTLHPKSAKHLWVKNFTGGADAFKRLTPKEFMAQKAADPAHFALFRSPKSARLIAAYTSGRAKAGPAQTVALFTLVDEVTLPARPYIRPAVEKAAAQLQDIFARHLETEVGRL